MRKRILVVDDERAILAALRKVLEAEGYEVVLAQTASQALERLEAGDIDLLLLDLDLTAHHGTGILEWLIQARSRLSVIVITGRQEHRERAQTAPVNGIMDKPLDVPLLLQQMRELLEEPVGEFASRVEARSPSDKPSRDLAADRGRALHHCRTSE